MNYEKIVTLYDTEQHAYAARRKLEAEGFAPLDISTIHNRSLTLPGEKLCDPELWQTLFGRNVDNYEGVLYGRVVESGGAVLIVRVPETDVPKALGILNAHDSVDLKKRGIEMGLITEEQIPGGDQVLALAEETLEIGKRVVREGTTRVRRFVSEAPAEAQVMLREEHVQVIRRVFAGPSSGGPIDWSERTIEITESVEEPVITKAAHIAEEVVIHKEVVDRVQVVRDTVRRQEIEVEHVPAQDLVRQ
jgi:uncharacterized protein (TIGR02271 family)